MSGLANRLDKAFRSVGAKNQKNSGALGQLRLQGQGGWRLGELNQKAMNIVSDMAVAGAIDEKTKRYIYSSLYPSKGFTPGAGLR